MTSFLCLLEYRNPENRLLDLSVVRIRVVPSKKYTTFKEVSLPPSQ